MEIMDVTVTKSTNIGDVSGVLQKLVEHYSQSVHAVEEKPPYFDSLLGYPVHLEPVVQYLQDILLGRPGGDIFDFVNGYVSAIRPVLVKPSNSCVPVLQNYEILLSQWIKHIANNGVKPDFLITNRQQVFHTIEVIASDVTLFTSTSEIKLSPYMRCNVAIPCLLRLLHHAMSLLSVYGFENRGGHACVIRCVVSLLAFDARALDPRTISKSIPTLHMGYINRQCACPPLNSKQYDAIDNLLSLEESHVGWNSVCINDMGWMDSVSGVASRTADGVWKALARLLLHQSVGGEESSAVDTPASLDSSEGGEACDVRTVLTSLDTLQLAKAIREHFFGQDMELWEPETRVVTQVVMGRRVTKTEPVVKDKPFIAIPSRVNVAIGFLQRLSKEEKVPSASRALFVQMMPIVFELLDAAGAAHIALGTSSLIHLLDTVTPSKEYIEGFAEPAISALDLDFTSRREGPLLLLIGQAQIRLLPLLNETNKRRRQLTKRWFSLLLHSSVRPTTIDLCLELLLGGIIPLLLQHSQQPNADAMELGRLGLSAILPLLANEFTSASIKAAALIALINLMIGAYPIMPDHGSKIMCHLLAFGLSLTPSTTSTGGDYGNSGIRQLCIHTGAVALHVCGEKNAGKLLDDLERARDDYQEAMQIVVADIKRETKALAHPDDSLEETS
jgi:hypothetical protein